MAATLENCAEGLRSRMEKKGKASRFQRETVADLTGQVFRCLVGRLGTEKRINREAFRSLTTRSAGVRLGYNYLKEIQANLWVFEFSDSDDNGEFWRASMVF
ncbi:hypothetical protein SLA2020_484320 [Shorea laevis]